MWTDGIPWWPLAVLALRDIAVTAGRVAVVRTVTMPAGPLGKLKTALQLGALTFFLLPVGGADVNVVAWWLLLGAVVIAVVSGAQYMARIVRVAQASPNMRETRRV